MFVAGGERRAVEAKNQNTAPQPGGRLRFRIAREILNFFSGVQRPPRGWYRQTTRRRGSADFRMKSRRLVSRRGLASADRRARERPARLEESFASRWTHGTSRARPLDGALCVRGRATVSTGLSFRLFSTSTVACCPPRRPRGTRFRAYRALARWLRPRGPDAGPRATFHLARARRARTRDNELGSHPSSPSLQHITKKAGQAPS